LGAPSAGVAIGMLIPPNTLKNHSTWRCRKGSLNSPKLTKLVLSLLNSMKEKARVHGFAYAANYDSLFDVSPLEFYPPTSRRWEVNHITGVELFSEEEGDAPVH
jgi:hypothetical protein